MKKTNPRIELLEQVVDAMAMKILGLEKEIIDVKSKSREKYLHSVNSETPL